MLCPDSAQLGFSVFQITIRHYFALSPPFCSAQASVHSHLLFNECMPTQTNSNDVTDFAPLSLPICPSITHTHPNPVSHALHIYQIFPLYYISYLLPLFYFYLLNACIEVCQAATKHQAEELLYQKLCKETRLNSTKRFILGSFWLK